MKSAVGDYITPDTREPRNQTYYGYLAGAGILINDKAQNRSGCGFIPTGPNQECSRHRESPIR